MSILKSFTILAIAITWNVEPVNAQKCQQLKPSVSQIKVANDAATLREEADTKSKKGPPITTGDNLIPLLTEQQSSIISKNNECWYKVESPNNNRQVYWIERQGIVSGVFQENELYNPPFIRLLIFSFFIIVIPILIVLLIIAFIKFIYFILSSLLKKISQLNSNIKRAKNQEKSTKIDRIPALKNKNLSANNLSKSNVKKINNITTSKSTKKPPLSPVHKTAPNSSNLSNRVKTPEIKPKSNTFIELDQHQDEQIKLQDTSPTLQQFILNFNQGSKQFFETESCFSHLKPTDNVIHGLAGNLGINVTTQAEVVEIEDCRQIG